MYLNVSHKFEAYNFIFIDL